MSIDAANRNDRSHGDLKNPGVLSRLNPSRPALELALPHPRALYSQTLLARKAISCG